MGLITCSKCKKIYDYNKYSGICPKCARYNRERNPAEEHQEFHDLYDGGYQHNEQDNHHSFHERYDEVQNPHEEKQGKKSRLGLIILLIFIALNFVFPLIGGILSTIYQLLYR